MDIVEEALDRFALDVGKALGEALHDIVIYGSYVLGDFRPGQGDLDYIVITSGNLSDGLIERLFALHDGYRRAGPRGGPIAQLEGAFYPRAAMLDHGAAFAGCYIGTRRRGWKKIGEWLHNCYDDILIRQAGRSYFGKSIEIREPSEGDIRDENAAKLAQCRECLAYPDYPPVEGIHWGSRALFYKATGRIGSKRESCELALREYRGEPFAGLIEYGVDRRSPWSMEEMDAAFPDGRKQARSFLDRVEKDLASP